MKYIPIKSTSTALLFIQAIIYMLNINGRCAIVLPYGQEIYSKSNKSSFAVREYLCRACDLQKVIILPAKMFTFTDIKTCIFYFIKKAENVVTLDVKCTKSNREYARNYNFIATHQTTSVKFYDYKNNTLLLEVPIDKIANNKYSLKYEEYKDRLENNLQVNNGSIVLLGDICTILPNSKRNASYGNATGTYPFFTSSQTCTKFCDSFDYHGEYLVIGTGGKANIKYINGKFSCSTDNAILKIKQHSTRYIYYYLLNNMYLLQNGFAGMCIEHISKTYIKSISVPVPSLEKQNEIIAYCEQNADRYNALVASLKKAIDDNEKLAKQYIDNALNSIADAD